MRTEKGIICVDLGIFGSFGSIKRVVCRFGFPGFSRSSLWRFRCRHLSRAWFLVGRGAFGFGLGLLARGSLLRSVIILFLVIVIVVIWLCIIYVSEFLNLVLCITVISLAFARCAIDFGSVKE
jgi:hypothetical protein